MYKTIIRPVLFLINPETVHKITFFALKALLNIPFAKPLCRRMFKVSGCGTEVFGIKFSSPVGIAAGLDKNAELFDELACFGFGFIEIGTLTPLAQPGNPRPRIFRLKKDEALINRMGFNNNGVESAVKKLKRKKSGVVIVGNIGKNKITPNEDAASDYLKCFSALYPYVDMFAVNVSSPNTPDLRELQEREPLKDLLSSLMAENKKQKKPLPILLKIAPDLTDGQLDDIVEIVKGTKIAGVIASNTTVLRPAELKTGRVTIDKTGSGGLSGKPLKKRSTEIVGYLNKKSGGAFPIVASGGIFTEEDAMEKFRAGASLVELYTGFVYEGPGLAKKINKTYAQHKSR